MEEIYKCSQNKFFIVQYRSKAQADSSLKNKVILIQKKNNKQINRALDKSKQVGIFLSCLDEKSFLAFGILQKQCIELDHLTEDQNLNLSIFQGNQESFFKVDWTLKGLLSYEKTQNIKNDLNEQFSVSQSKEVQELSNLIAEELYSLLRKQKPHIPQQIDDSKTRIKKKSQSRSRSRNREREREKSYDKRRQSKDTNDDRERKQKQNYREDSYRSSYDRHKKTRRSSDRKNKDRRSRDSKRNKRRTQDMKSEDRKNRDKKNRSSQNKWQFHQEFVDDNIEQVHAEVKLKEQDILEKEKNLREICERERAKEQREQRFREFQKKTDKINTQLPIDWEREKRIQYEQDQAKQKDKIQNKNQEREGEKAKEKEREKDKYKDREKQLKEKEYEREKEKERQNEKEKYRHEKKDQNQQSKDKNIHRYEDKQRRNSRDRSRDKSHYENDRGDREKRSKNNRSEKKHKTNKLGLKSYFSRNKSSSLESQNKREIELKKSENSNLQIQKYQEDFKMKREYQYQDEFYSKSVSLSPHQEIIQKQIDILDPVKIPDKIKSSPVQVHLQQQTQIPQLEVLSVPQQNQQIQILVEKKEEFPEIVIQKNNKRVLVVNQDKQQPIQEINITTQYGSMKIIKCAQSNNNQIISAQKQTIQIHQSGSEKIKDRILIKNN
ncbi:unnamed protein product [Paramecium sonneborni]|uniref:YTH domain-containing protein n=1 Tax=Paramecium sonneborni TaxID=65129 RepID=A0A8S1P027_9CILI|nr:unnamed protein product [Paramecium sonneborni]